MVIFTGLGRIGDTLKEDYKICTVFSLIIEKDLSEHDTKELEAFLNKNDYKVHQIKRIRRFTLSKCPNCFRLIRNRIFRGKIVSATCRHCHKSSRPVYTYSEVRFKPEYYLFIINEKLQGKTTAEILRTSNEKFGCTLNYATLGVWIRKIFKYYMTNYTKETKNFIMSDAIQLVKQLKADYYHTSNYTKREKKEICDEPDKEPLVSSVTKKKELPVKKEREPKKEPLKEEFVEKKEDEEGTPYTRHLQKMIQERKEREKRFRERKKKGDFN